MIYMIINVQLAHSEWFKSSEVCGDEHTKQGVTDVNSNNENIFLFGKQIMRTLKMIMTLKFTFFFFVLSSEQYDRLEKLALGVLLIPMRRGL